MDDLQGYRATYMSGKLHIAKYETMSILRDDHLSKWPEHTDLVFVFLLPVCHGKHDYWIIIGLLLVSVIYGDLLMEICWWQPSQENLVLVIGETPWFAHSANLGHPELDGQPVYTVFYAEWLINVTWVPKTEVSINGGFMRENPTKMDDLVVPHFRKPPY